MTYTTYSWGDILVILGILIMLILTLAFLIYVSKQWSK